MINLELTEEEFKLLRLAVAFSLGKLQQESKDIPILTSIIRKFTEQLKRINSNEKTI